MKKIVLATVVALGLGTAAAQAFPLPSHFSGDRETSKAISTDAHGRPHHRCHGQTTGQAHHSCGTRTGGPSGGLF